MPVKDESEDDNTPMNQPAYVNVTLACDEPGPSGLQQRKIGELPEMALADASEDPKSG